MSRQLIRGGHGEFYWGEVTCTPDRVPVATEPHQPFDDFLRDMQRELEEELIQHIQNYVLEAQKNKVR